jgi:hypothetical protein
MPIFRPSSNIESKLDPVVSVSHERSPKSSAPMLNQTQMIRLSKMHLFGDGLRFVAADITD